MLFCGSGAKECEPDHAEDQDGEPGRDDEKGKNRRPGLGLACFGRGFDDPLILSRGHGSLGCLMAGPLCGTRFRKQRMIPNDVPGF